MSPPFREKTYSAWNVQLYGLGMKADIRLEYYFIRIVV